MATAATVLNDRMNLLVWIGSCSAKSLFSSTNLLELLLKGLTCVPGVLKVARVFLHGQCQPCPDHGTRSMPIISVMWTGSRRGCRDMASIKSQICDHSWKRGHRCAGGATICFTTDCCSYFVYNPHACSDIIPALL